ncbi:hypothetical protein LXG23DRAFT_38084 [Yarrowia lipolytica]|nr:hypothetical protein LXG23DRAFT_38084 [Yarrowia lipolytica]
MVTVFTCTQYQYQNSASVSSSTTVAVLKENPNRLVRQSIFTAELGLVRRGSVQYEYEHDTGVHVGICLVALVSFALVSRYSVIQFSDVASPSPIHGLSHMWVLCPSDLRGKVCVLRGGLQ